MRVQISSGQGPAECELAVAMLYEELRKEAGDVRLVGCTPGKKPGCMSSVVFETDRDLRELECSGFAKVPTVPATRGRTGMWMSAYWTRSQGYQRKEWCVLKPSAAEEREDSM